MTEIENSKNITILALEQDLYNRDQFIEQLQKKLQSFEEKGEKKVILTQKEKEEKGYDDDVTPVSLISVHKNKEKEVMNDEILENMENSKDKERIGSENRQSLENRLKELEFENEELKEDLKSCQEVIEALEEREDWISPEEFEQRMVEEIINITSTTSTTTDTNNHIATSNPIQSSIPTTNTISSKEIDYPVEIENEEDEEIEMAQHSNSFASTSSSSSTIVYSTSPIASSKKNEEIHLSLNTNTTTSVKPIKKSVIEEDKTESVIPSSYYQSEFEKEKKIKEVEGKSKADHEIEKLIDSLKRKVDELTLEVLSKTEELDQVRMENKELYDEIKEYHEVIQMLEERENWTSPEDVEKIKGELYQVVIEKGFLETELEETKQALQELCEKEISIDR